MIIRNATAILAAIFLVTITSQANAKPSEFCGDRYCGKIEQAQRTHKQRLYHRPFVKKHKEKTIRLASLGVDEAGFTSESPKLASKGLLPLARSYLGTNPTGWRSLWCARFIAYIAPAVANRLKRMGLNPNWARDYARLPGAKRVGAVGDIVVLTRGRGGHIGVLAGFKAGNPIVVSGNHGHKVGTGVYSKHRVLAYVSI